MITRKAVRHVLPAALVLLSVAFCISVNARSVLAQDSKVNKRATPAVEVPAIEAPSPKADDTVYGYDFRQPEFLVSHIVIQHDSTGRGKLTFERLNEGSISEPLEISPAALARILGLYQTLNFLESNTNYQSDKQFPHLGTMKLSMHRQGRQRTAEFNWTNDNAAAQLVKEYRRVADQAIFVFDMSVARANQPLNAPKLLEGLETLLRRNEISDPHQLVPLLEEITTDEHLPLIARNHAGRLLKKINSAK